MGRLKAICTGEAGLSRCQRSKYINLWLETGKIDADPDTVPETVPTVWEKVKRVFRFFRALTVHVSTGAKTVHPKVQQLRMLACQNCPQYGKDGACKVCSCNLSIKTRWKSSQCPLGKW